MARTILCIIICLGAAYQACADGISRPGKTGESTATPEQTRREVLEHIIISKLDFYAGNFPNIDFVLLDSGSNTERNLGVLFTILGQDPIPLDYSHPESVRKMLLEATYVRIGLLLQYGIGSATLFAPGQGAHVKRKQACIITLNPWSIAQDNQAATRHLLELPGNIATDILPGRYLDADSQLRFALDHEIFHCLDSSLNGPVPMSKQAHWGDYYMWRNEAGADAFGILMHLADSGSVTPYARNLSLIRGLTLLNSDPNHYTYPVFETALHLDLSSLTRTNAHEIFRLATRIRNKVAGSYSNYLRYAVSAQTAMKRLGVAPGDEHFTDVTAEPAMVERLVREVRSNYRKLMGHELRITK